MLIDFDTYVYADTHFGHKKILDFCPNRVGDTIEEHDEFFHSVLNEVEGDLLCLGDFAFKDIAGNIERIRPDHSIILGNHDRKPGAYHQRGMNVYDGIYYQTGDSVFKLMGTEDPLLSALIVSMDRGNEALVLSHYPIHHMDEYTQRNERIVGRIEKIREAVSDLGFYVETAYNIHGHLHNYEFHDMFSFCVSVDQLDEFRPITIGDVFRMKNWYV